MKKPFLFSAKFILISFVLTAVLFAGFFYGLSAKINSSYDASIKAAPSIMKFSPNKAEETKVLFAKYGALAGLAFGVLFLLVAYLLFGLMAAIRLSKSNFSAPLAQLLIAGAIAIFAYNLAFDSGHGSALSSGIVFFIGYPLFYAFVSLSIALFLLTVFSFFPKKNAPEIAKMAVLLVCLSAVLSGCDVLSGAMTTSCGFISDSAHCYQEDAIATNNPDKCEKVPKKNDLKDLDSNPPKDKCFYQVAENKKDPETCKRIKGGAMSYSAGDCVESIVSDTEKEIKNKLDQGKNLSPEEISAIQSQMDKNQKMLEMASDLSKNLHETNMAIIRNLR